MSDSSVLVRKYSRIAMARLHLASAIDLLAKDVPWPTVLILARAAGQYLSDRLRLAGRSSFIADNYELARKELGVDFPFDVWKRRADGKADLFKHANDVTEPDEVALQRSDVTQVLVAAIADYVEVTGEYPDELRQWVEEHLSRPDLVASRERMRDPAHYDIARAHTAENLLAMAAAPKPRRPRRKPGNA